MSTPPSAETVTREPDSVLPGIEGNATLGGERRWPGALVLGLFALGLVLVGTTIAAPFTVDEDNYLVTVVALRDGGWGLANTAGLPSTVALLWFDPAFGFRAPPRGPVMSHAPPLYAPIALPFSFLGWRGLALLNTLAFLGAIALVYRFARAQARRESTAWIATVAFALGGYCFEYAQGVWPHMLSVFLSFAGIACAARARSRDAALWNVFAGLLIGWAAGVRFQNVVVAAAVGLGILLLNRRRWRDALLFAAGVAVPLVASSLVNARRLGTANPVTKGAGYTSLGGTAGHGLARLLEPLGVVWSMVVDFRAHPPMGGPRDYWSWAPNALGVFMQDGAVRKAWLQSSPWVVLALAFAVWVWWSRRLPEGQKREGRALSLVIAAMLATFGLAGYARHEGLCFNERYLLELTPIAAVLAGWALENVAISRRTLAIGALVGLATALPLTSAPGNPVRTWTLMTVPLLLAGALLISWLAGSRSARARSVATALMAASIAWGLAAHLADDLPASRKDRAFNRGRLDTLAALPATPSALMTVGGFHDALGPLLLDHDVVIANPGIDHGRSEHALVLAWFGQNRRVFLDRIAFPRRLLETLAKEWTLRPVGDGAALLEVLPRGDTAQPRTAP